MPNKAAIYSSVLPNLVEFASTENGPEIVPTLMNCIKHFEVNACGSIPWV